MAKIKGAFSQSVENKEPMGLSAADIYILLRKVADGDDTARQALKELLDIFDKTGVTDAILSECGHDESADMIFDTRAKKVREMHIRIKLNNIDIKIWRELKVPSNMRLDAFAENLLDAMGWMHEHLYQFRDGKCYYCTKEIIEDSFDSSDLEDMSKFTVGDLFFEKGKRIKFEYDFGDGWEHDVWLKGEREYEKGEVPVVSCFKGQGECPPEDCGGVWGYQELIAIAQKKKLTKDEREHLDWYGIGPGYDPNEYNEALYEFEKEVDLQ